MWVPPGPVEYLDPPNAPTSVPVMIPVACKEEVGEVPSDSRYAGRSSHGNSSTGSAVAIQPNIDTI